MLLAACAVPRAQTGDQTALPPPEPPASRDPLGRDSPRDTIAAFNLAVHRRDFVSAAQYLQTTRAQRGNTERLARDLTDLIDRYYNQPITAISDAPEGAGDDGLPLDRERLVLTMGERTADVVLVRVKDPQTGLVWLISSDTLAEVPVLRRSAGGTWLERLMPDVLLDVTVFGTSIARWLALLATIVVPYAGLWVAATLLVALVRRAMADSARRALVDSWFTGLRPLAVLIAALIVHLVLIPFLGFPLNFRVSYSRLVLAVAVFALALLLWRIMALSFRHARTMAQRRGQASIRSLLLLAERVSKTIVILAAIFALLTIAGVDTTTALAGVGIGGVALALGAQKSVENLLGGIFLLTDRALAVGDTCSISNRLGVVEDVTMRSVRLRTIEQTLLSVPAGILSQSSVENFSTRGKIPVQSTLRLRYGTTADQLREVLTAIRAALDHHPDVERATSRIRLVDFGVRAIELELFAYVLTPDLLEFFAIREALLLQIASIVETSGIGFAQPSIVYEGPNTRRVGEDRKEEVAPASAAGARVR